MIRINLLPHRAEKRRARQIQFAVLCGISVVLGAIMVAAGHGWLSGAISHQQARNNYLNQEIAVLDKQIDEIKKLREQTQSLLVRKDAVEKLQSDRSDVVHLLDQMLRLLPDGVYLKEIKQAGNNITLAGYAQSNARVSTLMRAIENSPWLDSPRLVEIKASAAGGGGRGRAGGASGERVSEFTLKFNLTKAAPAAPPSAKPAKAAKPAAKG
jgi:type IV pilus assembly protein PilN